MVRIGLVRPLTVRPVFGVCASSRSRPVPPAFALARFGGAGRFALARFGGAGRFGEALALRFGAAARFGLAARFGEAFALVRFGAALARLRPGAAFSVDLRVLLRAPRVVPRAAARRFAADFRADGLFFFRP
jgi:hypothetical protein